MRPLPVLAAVAALCLCSCSSRGMRENVFLFFEPSVYTPVLPGKALKAYPFKVQVKRFKIDPLYDNQKVVTRHTDFSVTFARHGEWALRPQTAASDLLVEYLKANFSIKAMREGATEELPDLIISGEMRAVEEDLRGEERAATLALTIKMTRARNDEVLFEETLRKSRPCEEYGYAALAREFSLCLSDIYRDFVVRLEPILSRLADQAREETKG